MFTVIETAAYSDWLTRLRDLRAVARIDARIRRVSLGSFGDAKALGDGVSEMRIDYGPGYRVYFTKRGQLVVILLCGGDKGSQDRDVKRAKELAKGL